MRAKLNGTLGILLAAVVCVGGYTAAQSGVDSVRQATTVHAATASAVTLVPADEKRNP
jgi:hypothetical protein